MTTTVRRGPVDEPRANPADAAPARRARPSRAYISLNGAAIVAIATVTLGIIGILYLIQTAQVAGLGYQLSRLQSKHDELALDTARLDYQVARYESLDTIQKVAVEQLGMTPLQSYKFIEIERPPHDDLPTLPKETFPAPSLWQRIEGAVLGIGRAHATPAAGAAASGKATP